MNAKPVLLAKALGDKDVSEEHRRQAEAQAAELAAKLGFTSAAVVEFFKILGEQSVPEEKVPARLIEVATHFAQTRDALAALEPDDPHAAALASSAKEALESGRLTEADTLLDRAKEGELAALRQARELKQKAQEAEDRHALNAAKLLAGRGSIALTQLRYVDAARHYEAAAGLLPSSASETKAAYLNQTGDMWQTSGNLEAALTSYQASHDIFERLAKADPGNAGWQRDLSVSQEKIGDVQQAQGEPGGAADQLPGLARDQRATGESGPRQRRLAARPSVELWPSRLNRNAARHSWRRT